MGNFERFGVFLPSYVWEDDGPERAQGIKDFGRHVEDLGFDSIFITDHLLAAKQLYSVSFLESLITLAVVAGVTERIRLGTSVMVLPIRNPVMLAKQVTTLQFLSRSRVVLGAGIGWYPPEYEAVGVDKSERGARTDEILDIIIPLLEGEMGYVRRPLLFDQGCPDRAKPRTPSRDLDWGRFSARRRRIARASRFAEAVKARILRSEGWIPRPTSPPDDIQRDWDELRAYLSENGRDPAVVLAAHENFMHFVATDDPAKAREEQHLAFLRVMSEARGPAYLEQVYLFGTPDEIVESLQARIDAGVQHFILHTMTPELDQLDQWATEIVPHVRFPEPVACRSGWRVSSPVGGGAAGGGEGAVAVLPQ